MNKRNLKKMEMYERCDIFFTGQQTLFSTYAPLNNAITAFKAAMPALRGYLQQQIAVITGYAAATEARKKEMVSLVVPISRKALAWARLNHRDALLAIFDTSFSRLMKMPNNESIGAVQDILDNISANIAALTAHRLVAEDIATAQERLDDFMALLETGGTHIKRRKEATLEIEGQIALMDGLLQTTDDLITGEYIFSNADMVRQYGLIREIGDPGYRHTGLAVRITGAAGAPLEGVIMKLRELNKVVMSDIDGLATVVSVRPGKYHVDFMNDGQARTEIVELKRGRVVEMNLAMAS